MSLRCSKAINIFSIVISNPTGYYSFYDNRGKSVLETVPIHIKVENSQEKAQILQRCKILKDAGFLDVPDCYNSNLFDWVRPVKQAWLIRRISPKAWSIKKKLYDDHCDSVLGSPRENHNHFCFGRISFYGDDATRKDLKIWIENFVSKHIKGASQCH